MKNYKKNCATAKIDVSKAIKERYEQDYHEEGNPITKVSLSTFFFLIIISLV
jgi:hypothetical protein